MNEEVTISRAEYESLKADKGRLDYLDECNRRLNAFSGSTYGWRMVQSPNVNRLMLDFPRGVDIEDAQAVGCHPTGLLSVRAAIDHATGHRTGPPPEADPQIDALLREWARDYELTGDVVRCRGCGRGIIYSRRAEELVHADGCKTRMAYPWDLLVALAPAKSAED